MIRSISRSRTTVIIWLANAAQTRKTARPVRRFRRFDFITDPVTRLYTFGSIMPMSTIASVAAIISTRSPVVMFFFM